MRPPNLGSVVVAVWAVSLIVPGCTELRTPSKETGPAVQTSSSQARSAPARPGKRPRPKRVPVSKTPPPSQRPPLPKVFEAEEFRVVDKDGNVRATLRLDDTGIPGLALYDENGRLRAILQVLEDGSPHLLFLDEKGNTPTNLHSLP